MNLIAKISLVAILLFASGCASIVSKSDWPVSISSQPEGASVRIKDARGVIVHSGTTPTTLSLSSKGGFFKGAKYSLEFQKDGHDPVNYELRSSLNGWYFGNVVFGGLIGMLIVDPATGAMYKIGKYVNVSLPVAIALKDGDSELQVVNIDDVPDEMRASLVPLEG